MTNTMRWNWVKKIRTWTIHIRYGYLRKKNNWLRLIQSSWTACVSLGFGINFTHALSCYYEQRFASFVQNRPNIAHERNSLIYESQAKANRPRFIWSPALLPINSQVLIGHFVIFHQFSFSNRNQLCLLLNRRKTQLDLWLGTFNLISSFHFRYLFFYLFFFNASLALLQNATNETFIVCEQ